MYKGGEALQDYGTGEYWAGVAKAGIVGSLTSLAYTGTVGYGLSKAGVGYVGKEADINESLAEIETQKKKAENLFANEKTYGAKRKPYFLKHSGELSKYRENS